MYCSQWPTFYSVLDDKDNEKETANFDKQLKLFFIWYDMINMFGLVEAPHFNHLILKISTYCQQFSWIKVFNDNISLIEPPPIALKIILKSRNWCGELTYLQNNKKYISSIHRFYTNSVWVLGSTVYLDIR